MARELKGLGDALVDGRRGIYSSRDPQRDPRIPERLVRLFHRPPATAPQPCGGGRKLEPLCADPPVYLVRNFLSARELEHLDALITSRRAAFKQSVTDDAGGKKISSAERTSFSLHLPKAADTTRRCRRRRPRRRRRTAPPSSAASPPVKPSPSPSSSRSSATSLRRAAARTRRRRRPMSRRRRR